MKKYFPFLEWIPNYDRANLGGDLSAGLTVGVMLIPQGMAYAMLAGLPPIYGLYAATIPLIIYALFGTSPQLAVGPVAMDSLLVAAGVGALAPLGSDKFIALAIGLALMVGIIQLSMGVLKLGFLVNFLSHPVIAGFTSAAALIIGFSQMKYLLGLEIPRGKVHETLISILENIGNINPETFMIGLVAIGILLVIKKMKRRIPGPLIVVMFGILVVYLLDLHEADVNIVGEVPGGLPTPVIPDLSMGDIQDLIPTAFTIAFVAIMEAIAVGKAMQAKHKTYKIVPNQELIALGLSNIFGSFFKAFPTTGGFSRTAVNDMAGAKSGLASIISAATIILTLMFLTSLFFYLPKAVLAAIIIVPVFGLINIKEARHLWKTDRKDFALFMITAIGTLTLGIQQGILIGVVLSIIMVVYHVSYPHVAELGKVPGSTEYRNLSRFEDLEEFEDVLIMRFDAQLFFANLTYFQEKLEKMLEDKSNVRHLILDFKAINNIDSSALHMMHDLIEDYRKAGIELYMADVKGPIRDTLKRSGVLDMLGEDHMFMTIDLAVKTIKHDTPSPHRAYATQTKY
ncbi:MAG: solute carrier family 26 protein [Bacteroidota bacterium]